MGPGKYGSRRRVNTLRRIFSGSRTLLYQVSGKRELNRIVDWFRKDAALPKCEDRTRPVHTTKIMNYAAFSVMATNTRHPCTLPLPFALQGSRIAESK